MEGTIDDVMRERVCDKLLIISRAKLTAPSSRTTVTDATARLPQAELKRLFSHAALVSYLSLPHCTLWHCDQANADKRPSSEKRPLKRKSVAKRAADFDKRRSLDKRTSFKKNTPSRRTSNRNNYYIETRY
jgi:hypothetical protein